MCRRAWHVITEQIDHFCDKTAKSKTVIHLNGYTFACAREPRQDTSKLRSIASERFKYC